MNLAQHAESVSEQPKDDATVHLLRAARGGDRSAMDALFVRYYPITMRIVELRLGRRIRGNVESEDVVQESLLDVFRGLDHFEMRSDGDFRNWLARIVEHNVRDRFRRVGAEKRGGGRERRFADLTSTSLSASLLPDGAGTPSGNAAAAELEERIQHVLMNLLQDPYREVIILRKLCGMSYEEVAKSMGYESTGTVRSLYTRAMEKLRSCLNS
jgi:RNA polymerase sigma-70 factor (ECF subfamily)